MLKQLVLEAVEKLIPYEEIEGWLEDPNLDLNGHTPREALNAHQYEEVIEALWHKDSQGPVS